METNDLYRIALSNIDDNEILNVFIRAKLPEYIYHDLLAIVSLAKNPIAVRSSSKLEDSYFQPFAGIYNTYMVPMSANKQQSIQMLPPLFPPKGHDRCCA